MILLHPLSCAACKRFKLPITLVSQYCAGWCWLSEISLRAAKWQMACGWYCWKAFLRHDGEFISPNTKGPNCTASRQPLLRLSNVTGVYPTALSALHAWDPTYPAPPVTNMFTTASSEPCGFPFIGGAARVNFAPSTCFFVVSLAEICAGSRQG